jgi:hypothetical protein
MAKAMPGGSGWRPATERPECSGIYAVHDGWAGIGFAVYCADSGGWGRPQACLRLFDATTAAQTADSDPGHEAWRELTDDEMLSLSPTAQAWAAGFLPAGAAILPGGGASPERPYSRRKRWSNLPKPPPATLDTGGSRSSQRRLTRS